MIEFKISIDDNGKCETTLGANKMITPENALHMLETLINSIDCALEKQGIDKLTRFLYREWLNFDGTDKGKTTKQDIERSSND